MMTSSAKTLTVASKTCNFPGRSSLWIYTAAGPQMGFGHLKRSLILARALQDCCTPLFLLDPEDRWSEAHLTDRGCDCFGEGFQTAWKLLSEPAAIVIDTRIGGGLYDLIAQAKIRKIPVISIHDLGLNLLPSDLIIDGSIAPAYQGFPNQDSMSFSGTEYMILDPACRILHQKRKTIREKIRSIYINLGGGDAGRYYWRVLEGLRHWSHEVEVVGVPGFVSWGQESLSKKNWHPLHFRWEHGNPVQFLFRADLAITAGGIAAYEALCAGTPLLALSYDPQQQITITTLGKLNACVNLGPGDELNPAALPGVISLIETNVGRRSLQSCLGRRIVDGLGAERVARMVRRLIYERSTAEDPKAFDDSSTRI